MSIEAGGEAVAEVNTNAAPEAAVLSQETDTRDWEAEARETGWVPPEEFKDGDKRPAKIKTAQEWVEETPASVRRMQAKFSERLAKIESVNAKTLAAVERQHAQDLSDLKAEKREAIKAGDAELVEEIEGKIDALNDDAPTPEKKLTGAALEKHNEKVQKDWIAKQAWWDADEDLTNYAIGQSQRIAGKNPDITIEDNLAQVEAALRKKFPEKFGGKPAGANGHAPVDGGGSFQGSAGGKKSPLAGLTATERNKAAEDMAAFPKIYPTEQSWLDTYNAK